VSTAYGRILETMADENMEWYTSVIKKACEELGKAGNRSTGGDSGVGDIATPPQATAYQNGNLSRKNTETRRHI
jgi:hypothetical protein